MPWLAVVLNVDASCADEFGDALLAVGALAVDISDPTAEGRGVPPTAGRASGTPDLRRVKALFAHDADPDAALSRARASAGISHAIAFEVQRIEDQDWVRASQREFVPLRISSRLWIVPSWHAPPDPAAVNVILDPGLAFGTGTHQSTRLCLRWLDAQLRGGETVLDFGCGSGILAIAALKLGAAHARGVDIDPQALVAARDNAVQNQVGTRFVAIAEAGDEPAEIVVANILANPLIVLAPLLARLTAPGGRIALSGILDEQADEVRAAYAAHFAMDEEGHDDGWALLGGVRKRGAGER